MLGILFGKKNSGLNRVANPAYNLVKAPTAFRIDGIFCDGRLVEIKTIKDDDAPVVDKSPKGEHVVQANFYLGTKSIDCVLLSYFKRSNGKHVVTWEIDFDKELYNKTIEKIKRIISGKDLIKDDSDCGFCAYKDACKRGIKLLSN